MCVTLQKPAISRARDLVIVDEGAHIGSGLERADEALARVRLFHDARVHERAVVKGLLALSRQHVEEITRGRIHVRQAMVPAAAHEGRCSRTGDKVFPAVRKTGAREFGSHGTSTARGAGK